MEAVIAVPDASVVDRRCAPGGLSLLERQLRQLRAAGHGPVTLLVRDDGPRAALGDGVAVVCCRERGALGEASEGGRTRDTAGRSTSADAAFAMLAAARPLPVRFLFLAADWLIDDRVLRAAASAADDTLMRDGEGRVAPVGRLTSATVARVGAALPARLPSIALDAIDRYAPELRGEVAPHLFGVRSAAARRCAWTVLLDRVQKRGLDLPGEYFDSPFENVLLRLLAPTRVTPNQLTFATLVVAASVGWLFLRGALALGLGLALVVGILDGVDGKLARLKLATSRLGGLEHVGDFLYENLWYVTLALHFCAATKNPAFWYAGLALVGCDLVDNLLYGAVRARTGRLLDELSPLDRAIRRVAGRRNVYVWILVAGVCARRPAAAFLCVAAWAAITVAVHGVRAALWLGRTAQVSEMERVAGELVTEK